VTKEHLKCTGIALVLVLEAGSQQLVMEARGKSFRESRAKFLMLAACLESHKHVNGMMI
jgi:hypothetical protein